MDETAVTGPPWRAGRHWGGCAGRRRDRGLPEPTPGEPLALGGEHIGIDVIAPYHGVGRAGAKAAQHGSEERRGKLAHHLGLGA
jgi:hypothetical protein